MIGGGLQKRGGKKQKIWKIKKGIVERVVDLNHHLFKYCVVCYCSLTQFP